MHTIYDALQAEADQLDALKDTDFICRFPSFVLDVEKALCQAETWMEYDGSPDAQAIRALREHHALFLGALHGVLPAVLDASTELARNLLRCLPVWCSHLPMPRPSKPALPHSLSLRTSSVRARRIASAFGGGTVRATITLPAREQPLAAETPVCNLLPC